MNFVQTCTRRSGWERKRRFGDHGCCNCQPNWLVQNINTNHALSPIMSVDGLRPEQISMAINSAHLCFLPPSSLFSDTVWCWGSFGFAYHDRKGCWILQDQLSLLNLSKEKMSLGFCADSADGWNVVGTHKCHEIGRWRPPQLPTSLLCCHVDGLHTLRHRRLVSQLKSVITSQSGREAQGYVRMCLSLKL